MKFKISHKPIPKFSFIYLLNLFFLLLLILFITALTSNKSKGILSYFNNESIPNRGELVIILKDSLMFLDGMLIRNDNLQEKIMERKNEGMSHLVITYDSTFQTEFVSEIINKAKAAGFTKFTIQKR